MTKDAATTWERHGQSLIAALILAAIIWVGKGITDLTGTMGVVLNRIQNIEHTIAAMDERFDKYQTKREAESAKETQLLRDKMLHSRIDALEKARDK